MPRGDGTGPIGGGRGCGRGINQVGSKRAGLSQAGCRMGGVGAGVGGECLCPQCGTKAPHERGTPCTKQTCPQCGAPMVRA